MNHGKIELLAVLAGVATPLNLVFIAFGQGLAQAEKPRFGEVSGLNY